MPTKKTNLKYLIYAIICGILLVAVAGTWFINKYMNRDSADMANLGQMTTKHTHIIAPLNEEPDTHEETTSPSEPAEEIKSVSVYMEDKSGSAGPSYAEASKEYDMVIPASDKPGSIADSSHIISCVYAILNDGIKQTEGVVDEAGELYLANEVGFGTDLNSFPENEAEGLDFSKPFENRHVNIYLATNTRDADIDRAEMLLTQMLDEKSCSLIFTNVDGTVERISFDNYQPVTNEPPAEESTEDTAVEHFAEEQVLCETVINQTPVTGVFTRTDVGFLFGMMFYVFIVMALLIVGLIVLAMTIYKKVVINNDEKPAGGLFDGIKKGKYKVVWFKTQNLSTLKVGRYIKDLVVDTLWVVTYKFCVKTVNGALAVVAEEYSVNGFAALYEMIQSNDSKPYLLFTDGNFTANSNIENLLAQAPEGCLGEGILAVPGDSSKVNAANLNKIRRLFTECHTIYLPA